MGCRRQAGPRVGSAGLPAPSALGAARSLAHVSPTRLPCFPTSLTFPHGRCPRYFRQRGPHAQSLPPTLQPSGLLQREMSWRPRPAPLSSRPPPPGPGSQVRGVLYRLSWTRADPIRVAPPPPAAAGITARTPRRGRAGTAGSNCNTVMTSVKQQASWRLSPGYSRLSPGSSRRAPGAVLPDV